MLLFVLTSSYCDSVEFDRASTAPSSSGVGLLITLKGKEGQKSMLLEYSDHSANRDAVMSGIEWAESLRFLVSKINRL